jgi:hypothetical protein
MFTTQAKKYNNSLDNRKARENKMNTYKNVKYNVWYKRIKFYSNESESSGIEGIDNKDLKNLLNNKSEVIVERVEIVRE